MKTKIMVWSILILFGIIISEVFNHGDRSLINFIIVISLTSISTTLSSRYL